MKVLVFGAGGQVGSEVRRAAWPASCELAGSSGKRRHHQAAPPSTPLIAQQRPDLVINLAAYTAVDRAESEARAGLGGQLRRRGQHRRRLRRLARRRSSICRPTTYSTGAKPDPTARTTRSTRSASTGAARRPASAPSGRQPARHVILRTAWVYGAHGGKFRQDHAAARGERPVLRVVADQHGSPDRRRRYRHGAGRHRRHIERRRQGLGHFPFRRRRRTQLARVCRGDHWHGGRARRVGRRIDTTPRTDFDRRISDPGEAAAEFDARLPQD